MANIVAQFDSEFKVTFSADKKAHFDNLPEEFRQIDGAKPKWCNLLLMDAIIYLVRNDTFSKLSRRAFNQHITLYDCILDELKAFNLAAYDEIVGLKKQIVAKKKKNTFFDVNQVTHDLIDKYTALICQQPVFPFDSIENLRHSLENDGPASKAKNKHSIITELLCNHETVLENDNDLNRLIQQVIFKQSGTDNNLRDLSCESGSISATSSFDNLENQGSALHLTRPLAASSSDTNSSAADTPRTLFLLAGLQFKHMKLHTIPKNKSFESTTSTTSTSADFESSSTSNSGKMSAGGKRRLNNSVLQDLTECESPAVKRA
eukprot:gene33937-41858_t